MIAIVACTLACSRHDAPVTLATIDLIPVGALEGSGDTVDLVAGSAVRRSGSGWFVAAPVAATQGSIALYAPDGRLARTLGRIGQGPGEISAFRGSPNIGGIGFGPGDSLFVGDYVRRQISVFSPPPGIAFVRSFATGSMLHYFEAYADGLLTGPFMMSPRLVPERDRPAGPIPSGMAGMPPRVFSWDGAQVAQYGLTVFGAREDDVFGVVAPSDSGRIWFGVSRRYAIRLTENGGTVIRRLERNVDWFPPDTTVHRSVFEKPPPTAISSISQGEDGTLWVLIRRASRHWIKNRPAKPPVLRIGMPIQLMPPISMNDYYETVLEALDPVTGRLLASRELTGDVRRFIGPGLLYQQPEDSTGILTARIWRVSVKPR